MIDYIAFDKTKITELVRLWNETIGKDFPMRETLFYQNSIADENVCLDSSLIAVDASGNIAGFVIAKYWRESLDVTMHMTTGWIQVLLVGKAYRKKGIGTKLLQHAEVSLKEKGMKQILLGKDPYHYFPGIPKVYSDLAGWFVSKGYEKFGDEVDLTRHYAQDEGMTISPVNNAEFSLLTLDEKDEFLAFMNRCFPGRWEYEAVHYFAKGGTGREFVVLKKQGKIVGFSRINDAQSPMIAQNVYWSPLFENALGGVGPLGIDANERKQGYGIAIVEAAIAFLRKRNIRQVVIDWTTLIDFYKRLGYDVWKEYGSYKKEF